ncbi:13568_t:CDS:1 [Cetraspora pellucida]|uniref:13568_t:CDS:1 n=1 Tax=Cetraspora pellucida TaxID=1433469 RepID=A0A9N9BFX0_9GLOM|nr:13568_t:CDS:1 [Cetraspora pellucida]
MNKLTKFGKSSNVDVYTVVRVLDNIEYGVVNLKKSNNEKMKIIIRGIKGKSVGKTHIELLSVMLGRLYGTRWGHKIIIVHEDSAVINIKEKIKKFVVFIPVSQIVFYLRALRRNYIL